MDEVWVDIPDYEGLYQCSTLGNIRSLKNSTPRIMNGSVNIKNGYRYVSLRKDGKQRKVTYHSIVCQTFLNHKPNGRLDIVIDHINCNKLDNSVSNLRLISHRANISRPTNKKTSIYPGVSFVKGRNKWRSDIKLDDGYKFLGIFNREEDAAEAYKNELTKININESN